MMIDYRIITEPADFERVVDLEIAVWGLDPRDAVPATMLRAVQHGGGLVNGAFAGDQLVGLGMMFPIPHGERLILWSHITGVDPAYQKAGIGLEIKLRQRAWALNNGYDEIRWTFDPLQRGNANFNLHKLGATFDTYLVNFYGTMTDAINKGMPSDRVEAVWRLNSARVIALANGQAAPAPETHAYPFLLTRDHDGLPCSVDAADGQTPSYLVALPPKIQALDATAVMAWRLALRETLVAALAAGYVAVDFLSEQSAYILHKSTRLN